jgi:hypothetical protein
MSSSDTHASGVVRAWFELFRLPNLFTVPGDPVAGFLLAGAVAGAVAPAPLRTLALTAGASVLLYMMGLALNDWADQREDAVARPKRPIPSGRISSRSVLVSCLVLTTLALFLASVAGAAAARAAAILALTVMIYDLFAKRIPIVGIVVMGCCRGLSLILGAVAAGWRPGVSLADPVLLGAVALTLYVTAFSRIAAGETGRRKLRFERWLPPLAVAAGAARFAGLLGLARSGAFLPLIAALLASPGWPAARLGPEPDPPAVQRSIKACIMGMFVFQAALCAVNIPAGLIAAAAILAALPVSLAFAKKFYVTCREIHGIPDGHSFDGGGCALRGVRNRRRPEGRPPWSFDRDCDGHHGDGSVLGSGLVGL